MEIFTTLDTMVQDMLGPMGWLMIVGGLGLVMIIATLPVLLKREEDPLDKLKTTQRAPTKKDGKAERLRTPTSKDKLEKYSTFLEPQDAEEYSAVKLKPMQAGYKSRNAVRFYHFSQFALGILGLMAGGVYAIIKTSQGDVTTQNLMMMIMGPGVAGYMLPKYWVTRRQATRQENITNPSSASPAS